MPGATVAGWGVSRCMIGRPEPSPVGLPSMTRLAGSYGLPYEPRARILGSTMWPDS